MQKAKVGFAAMFMSLSWGVYGQTMCPIPEGLEAAAGMAKEVVEYHRQNIPKAVLLRDAVNVGKQLPWAGKMMNSMVEEVYSQEIPISTDIYAIYRMEMCFASTQYQISQSQFDFKKAYPLLRQCEALPEGKVRINCSMQVVYQASGRPSPE